MFDIGFWELVLCAVVALVVLGPERMPQAVRTGLIWWRAARQTLQQVRSTLEHEISQMEQIVQPTETTSAPPPQASNASTPMPQASNASTPMPQATPDHPAPAAMPSDLSEAIEALKAASPVSSEATDQAAAAAWPPSAQAIPSAQAMPSARAMPSGASPSTARAAIMPEVTDAQPVNVPPPSTGPAAPAAEVAAAIAALKAASPVQTAAPTTPRGDQP